MSGAGALDCCFLYAAQGVVALLLKLTYNKEGCADWWFLASNCASNTRAVGQQLISALSGSCL